MITITPENYKTELPQVNFKDLPKVYHSYEEQIPKLLSQYGKNPDVTRVADGFLDKLNKALSKLEKPAAEVKKTSGSNKKKTTSSKPKPKPKPKSKPTPKVTTKTKAKTVKVSKILVNHWQEDDRLIRRFISLIKKPEITRKQIASLHKAISKAVINRKVRKTDDDADLLILVKDKVEKMYKAVAEFDDDNDTLTINITDAKFKKLLEQFSNKKIDPVVTVLNSFINLQGTEADNVKIERLLKRLNNLDISKHRLKDEVKDAIKLLSSVNTIVPTNTQALSGLNNVIQPSRKPHFNHPLIQSFNELRNETKTQVNENYKINGNISKFLGKVEIKPKHSVVVTIDSEQGGGKTRFLFQCLNELAENDYKCLFVSLEEHPSSTVFKAKQVEYISKRADRNIDSIGELPNWYSTLAEIIPFYDAIFVDSWSKMAEQDRNLDLDIHFRKKYDGKLFFPIYQRTTSGSMRGGSKSQFDGDIILKIHKDDDYEKSYVYANKNRYQDTPLNQLRYNIYKKRLLTPKEIEIMDSED